MDNSIGYGECEMCGNTQALCIGTMIGWLCKDCCEIYKSHLEDCIEDLEDYTEMAP